MGSRCKKRRVSRHLYTEARDRTAGVLFLGNQRFAVLGEWLAAGDFSDAVAEELTCQAAGEAEILLEKHKKTPDAHRPKHQQIVLAGEHAVVICRN